MKRRRLDDDHRRNNEEKEIVEQIFSNNNKHIPMDITAEILSRLPIKSIGRFISVSKSWRDIITGRCFSSLHAKNKFSSTFYNIGRRSVYDSQRRHYVFEVDENGNSVTTIVRPRIDEPSKDLQFVGSCNGLLCLLESLTGLDAITILNPITNKRTVVMLPNHKYGVDEFHYFCYSPSTDEYKVFKQVKFSSCSAYAIFTVGVDQKWRELSPLLFSDRRTRHDNPPVFCNGALHWLIDNNDPSSNHIIAFDIARENTRRMPIPQGIGWHTTLSVFDNRVSLNRNRLERPDMGKVVWNVDGSWSRVVVPNHYKKEIFEPLHCETKYGDVLLAGKRYSHIWLYCPKQERHTNTGVVHYRGDRLFEFTPTFSSIEEILYGGESSMQHNVLIDAY